MKILLIKPQTNEKMFPGDDLFMNEPLELEYIAASVSDNHEVRILDMRLDQSLEKHLEEYRPDVVGLTSYTTQVYMVKNLCKIIKAFNPQIFTVVGGVHATLAPGDFCDPNINIITRGEGIDTFREIVQRIETNPDVSDIKGISFYHKNELKHTESRCYTNLDCFPFPNRSLTEHYRDNYFYETADMHIKPIATMRTSRGCPFRCNFCAQWKFTNGKYLTRDPHAIVEEIKTIKEPNIYFGDDETFVDLKRVDKLADIIIDTGIKKQFFSFARSDTVVNHPDLFKKWRTAGLIRVLMGFESNRPKDIEYFRKKNTINNNEKAISILKNMGFKIDVSFIITPDYDIEDFDKLTEYARNLGADFVIFASLTPLPGTDLYEELKDQLTTTNLELFDMTHMVLPSKLPLKTYYREMAYAFVRIYKGPIGKSDRVNMLKFMKLHNKLKLRHLHHQ